MKADPLACVDHVGLVVKINHFKPVAGGEIDCATDLVHRGRTIAYLESTVRVAGVLVGKAKGTCAILRPARAQAEAPAAPA